MKKYPVSSVGLLIMIAAVVIGFNPSGWSMLLLFVTTLFGGYMIKKNAPESYDGFIKLFGYVAAAFNLVAAGLIMLTPLDYVDKASASFLNLMVFFVIITLMRVAREKK